MVKTSMRSYVIFAGCEMG